MDANPEGPRALPGRPFVFVFAQSARWRVYDVNTNGVLEVDEALGRVVAALAGDEPAPALRRVADAIGREPVGRALAEVATAQREEGLFLPTRSRVAPRRLSGGDRAAYRTGLTHLILSLTADCNLACRYCPQAMRHARRRAPRRGRMASATALRALAYFRARCGEAESPTVSFYGGEPLLRPDLVRAVVEAAGDRHDGPRPRFVIDTNGTLLDEDACDLIAREGLHLQVSLDGPAAVHDRWRVDAGGRGSHAAVLAGLRRLLRRDPAAAQRIALQVTVAPPFDLEALADWSAQLAPFREFGLAPPHVRVNFADLGACGRPPTEAGPPAPPRLDDLRRHWLDACAQGRRSELDPVTRAFCDPEAIRFYHRSRSRLPAAVSPGACCLPGVRRLHATADGRFEPCERMAAPLPIGDVRAGIDEAKVTDLQRRFGEALAGRCRDCWARRQCEVCFAALVPADGGAGLAIHPDACARARRHAESRLRLYDEILARGPAAAAFLSDTVLM